MAEFVHRVLCHSIPVPRFDIDDGDVIRWKIVENELVADVQHRDDEAFDDFEPGESEHPADGVAEHDGFGVE